MSHYLDNFKERNQEQLKSDELDKRLIELAALFEISQTLNSSLNLKSILDNILFVPMGRMMISKGIILLEDHFQEYKIENIKGLPFSLVGKEIHIKKLPEHPVLISELDSDEDWIEFFKSFKIELLLPLISKRELRGLIAYSKKLTGQVYSDEEIEFLSSLANMAIQSIENALVFEKLNEVNRELDHTIQELNTLFEIGKELNQIFNESDILKQLSYSLMGQMLINQFFVALKTDGKFRIAFKKGSSFNSEALNSCREFCEKLPDIQDPTILHEDERFSELYEIGVRLIVPMVIQNENGGYIFLGEKLDKSRYSKGNLNFLNTLANLAMISLENARLFQETLEKQRLEEELNLAKSIQMRLLPSQMPKFEKLDVHGLNLPSKQVGGDYFDIIKLNEKEYLITVADVSGKGMPASLLMSNLQAGIQTLSLENYPLNVLTAKLNNLIYRNTSIEKYITFFVLKINIETGKIEYVNAGHNPPFLFTQHNEHRILEKGGIILGMMSDVEYETGHDKLTSGDCIIMFTDGVTEAMNENEEEFQEKRVIQFIKSNHKSFSAEELNAKLIDELKKFCGDPTRSDDVTIVTLKWC
jgi:sigma-B regulation protein RsbU (phosphoserine phosphatase)